MIPVSILVSRFVGSGKVVCMEKVHYPELAYFRILTDDDGFKFTHSFFESEKDKADKVCSELINNLPVTIESHREEFVRAVITGDLQMYQSHYDYLDLILENFWLEVFGKTPSEMWCAGIVSAHGDKCYQYKHEWEDSDILFKHGTLIFLLTYTSELGDTPKHKSCEWVVENYSKYAPKIKAAEEKTVQQLREKHGVNVPE